MVLSLYISLVIHDIRVFLHFFVVARSRFPRLVFFVGDFVNFADGIRLGQPRHPTRIMQASLAFSALCDGQVTISSACIFCG